MRTLTLHRICKGLYTSHEYGISLSHETSWHTSVGRKWEATWRVSSAPGIAPHEVSRKFDTYAEARAFLQDLIN